MIIAENRRIEIAVQIWRRHGRNVLIREGWDDRLLWAIVVIEKIEWIEIREKVLNGILLLLLELLILIETIQEVSDGIVLCQVGKETKYGPLLLLVTLVVIVIVVVSSEPVKEWRASGLLVLICTHGITTNDALTEAIRRIKKLLLIDCVGVLRVKDIAVSERTVGGLKVDLVLLVDCVG